MKHFLLTLLLGLGVAIPCQAGLFDRACSHCGCGELKKVCRVVTDVKKVAEVKYDIEEEEVCLPGKSCWDERIVADPCGQRCETVQTPRCGRIVCKKKLKKTTTTVEKPTVKCIVEIVCCHCGCTCRSGNCGQ